MLFVFMTKDIRIVLKARDSEAPALPSYSGPEAAVAEFKRWLALAGGPFGHLGIVDRAGRVRPGDLFYALGKSGLEWELVEGEIIEFASPPPGCVS